MKNKTIMLIIVLILIIISIIYLQKSNPAVPTNNLNLNNNPVAPELTGITGYINANDTLSISSLKGKVVLVDFWTYSCINCIRTLPHLVEWDKKYKNNGLVIIGVHTPEFDFEKNIDNVKSAVKEYDIEYPVVLDNNYATWNAYSNSFWPRKYLIDSKGYIHYNHIGEGSYEETEIKIRELLTEAGYTIPEEVSTLTDTTPKKSQTPELYTGYDFALPRNQDIGNSEGLAPDISTTYQLPSNIKDDVIYLDGTWISNKDNLATATNSEASIVLSFVSSAANIVADSSNGSIKVEVLINDKYVSKESAGSDVIFENNIPYITVDKPKLYNVFKGDYSRYKLTLKINKEGFSFNSFTFG